MITTTFRCDLAGCTFMYEVGPQNPTRAVGTVRVLEVTTVEPYQQNHEFCCRLHMLQFFINEEERLRQENEFE